ncbi:transmembrane protein 205 [Schistocerca americana]|uniref:transmembrane protein 205 n=1 Tax=Schistocerca americana TaxID=7009 RepID=UPI001F4F559F|nr:transmembrane protein 205 [Schistocerca americana]XP_049947197.1 transmembrane protein 205 [Schistocerca serialis cubense]
MCRSQIADIVDVSENEGTGMSKKLLLKNQKRKAIKMMRTEEEKHSTEPPPVLPHEMLNTDLLAVATSYYRSFIDSATDIAEKWKGTKAYRVMFQTTQPAHVITIVAVSVVASLVCNKNNTANSFKPSPWINLLYLGAFMTHFGAQMWMTFVSGLTLYFEIPRHTFGVVQKVLFPKYFSLNSFLSMITLFLFVRLHPRSEWDSSIGFQVFIMSLCFLLELVIRLYLTPPLLRLMTAKTAIEKAAGVGLEVGKHNPGPLAHCPHYVKMHQAFRKIHMAVAIGNILTMACTTVHLHYLASKICFL